MLKRRIIDPIRSLGIEDLAGHIKCAEVGTQRRTKNRAAVDVGRKRYRKHSQVDGQYKQADELNVGTVQAAFDYIANRTCELFKNVANLLKYSAY